MVTAMLTPSVNLEGIHKLVFVYDQDDIATIHIDGPRPALTEHVDDGWYLRVADGAIVGIELHGLKRIFLSKPFYSTMFQPALREIETLAGQSFDGGGDIRAEARASRLPHTTRLLIFMLGQAMVKYDSARQAEYDDAGRELLAV